MTLRGTTVARLTSSAPSAIAVIELRGPQAEELVHRHWSPNQGSSDLAIDRIRYGVFRGSSGHAASIDSPIEETIGESIIVVRRAPDRYELHCHGGHAAGLSILRTMVSGGAQEISRQDWIEREVEGTTAAQATEDLLRATTVRTAAILMDQARGALDREWVAIQQHLRDGQLQEARKRADELLRWADVGLHLVHPWHVVLCGPPNVGKSSLLNRLLGYGRAVVHEQAGTTRDLLAESTSIDGWPVTLVDSAGVRDSEQEVESMGIQRSRRAIADADRLLLLIDPLVGWTSEQEAIWRSYEKKCMLVSTKSDLTSTIAQPIPLPASTWTVSSVSGAGIEALMRGLARLLVPNPPQAGCPLPFRPEHLTQLTSLLATKSATA